MKKHYILNIKSYILVTLYIMSIFALFGEQQDIKTLIITKIIGLSYFTLFTYANIIKHR